MTTPSIRTEATCLGCGEHLYTTGAEIDARVDKTEAIELKDIESPLKGATNTIRVWCISDICPRVPQRPVAHRAIFTGTDRVTGVDLPTKKPQGL